jgi:hypothetical protein
MCSHQYAIFIGYVRISSTGNRKRMGLAPVRELCCPFWSLQPLSGDGSPNAVCLPFSLHSYGYLELLGANMIC